MSEAHNSEAGPRWVADDEHEGTPESVWMAGGFLDGLPELEEPTTSQVVVVAPHPDDEVLGAGGLIANACQRGALVTVVAVTDGEGSHPHVPILAPAELVKRRAEEAQVALRRLTSIEVKRVRLGLPDGGVADHEQRLASALGEVLGPHALCLAPWDHDGHPDHDAAGRAAASACGLTGATLLSYLVWTWHWSHPADPEVPWSSGRRWVLDQATSDRKRWAVDAFASQLRPVTDDPREQPPLPAAAVTHWLRPFEVYLP